MDDIISYLAENGHDELYFTEVGIDLINQVQEMITRERNVIKEEKGIIVPGCQLYLINNKTINGFTDIVGNEYCILIHKGVIEEQKQYLTNLQWDFVDKDNRAQYIDDVVKYGFFFFCFHEYAHIFCGHVATGLSDYVDKRAQECEADMVAMDYLVKYILLTYKEEECTAELEKMYLAVYFLFQNMQKENYREIYNDKLIQNYYDEDRIAQRNHPLDAQRIMYLFEMLNVVVLADNTQVLPIKDNIIYKLRELKGLKHKDLEENEIGYQITSESIKRLKEAVASIRIKIPRMGNRIKNCEESSVD